MQVRIYQPSKSAMQSGRGKTKFIWLIEPVLPTPRGPEPVMGWTSAGDTLSELRNQLRFATKEEAVAFALKRGWKCDIEALECRRIKPRNYLDNFRYIRPQDEERQTK
ncbi:MAG: ETC complex I subunit [Alphaproteobacteria bacterium]